ncbi:rCG57281 [Rattus norvegicus]|uniref:RCG57281 n=1 Tax=Rattus norvegicus TaxID=10116 RepID=A6JPD6_RAT|nr:rCG57281 [Rattus norvegicus]
MCALNYCSSTIPACHVPLPSWTLTVLSPKVGGNGYFGKVAFYILTRKIEESYKWILTLLRNSVGKKTFTRPIECSN